MTPRAAEGAGLASAPPAVGEPEVAALMAGEAERLASILREAQERGHQARKLAREGRVLAAVATLDQTLRVLPENPATLPTVVELRDVWHELKLAEAQHLFRVGDVGGARTALGLYQASGRSSRTAEKLARRIARAQPPAAPPTPPGEATARSAPVVTLLGAQPPTRTEPAAPAALPPEPEEAASFGANALRGGRAAARQTLLEEVDHGWQRAQPSDERAADNAPRAARQHPLTQKLSQIVIPHVSFTGIGLNAAASALSEASAEYDSDAANGKGVNIVVIDPQNQNPALSITLRQLSLKRVLDFVTDAVGYRYEVQSDAVVIRPGGETSMLDTDFFPVTRSTVLRMTGVTGATAAPAADSSNPFASGFGPIASAPAPGGGAEAQALRLFLQQAGVNFDGTPGASLAYDGSAMIVTQTARNLERIRNILNRYNDVRQVEIEAKFMEVQEGALEELGVNWSLMHGRGGDPAYAARGETGNRSLAEGFSHTISGQTGRIVNPGRETEVIRNPDGSIFEVVPGQNEINQPIINHAPNLPGGVDLATQAGPLAVVTGLVGEFDIEATIRALSRQAGTDLLSAPKVTVLSGNPATITVAQELRYPQSYGEIQSQVGSARSDSSSAGVTITAGTPQDFATRNVGVELRVTPTVEEDDYSISLDLNPKVTEFEGFVEYGGQSVAISGGTTVTVPSGFFQPIFSTREVTTKVTIWDGATLVMGGLTREEVKQVHDKVPILGSIPGLGRLFRSKAESTQKRNLLIFVTANLVSPGGSPKKQELTGVEPSSLYQNPTLVTPAGPSGRARGGR